MRSLAIIVVVASALAGTAQAQTMRNDMSKTCGEEARRQNLKGDQMADFLTRCWAGQPPAMSRQQCQAEARRQGLSGEQLSAFMNKCGGGETMMK